MSLLAHKLGLEAGSQPDNRKDTVGTRACMRGEDTETVGHREELESVSYFLSDSIFFAGWPTGIA